MSGNTFDTPGHSDRDDAFNDLASSDSAPAYDVIVYGTFCLDAIWRVEELPSRGGFAPILAERKMIGGEAANTAIALARWGARVALIGNAIGDDAEGRLLRELLARDAPELDTRFIRTLPDFATPYCVCIATPDGERTMYGTGFSDMQCSLLDPTLARSVPLFTMDPNAWEPGRRAALVAAEMGAALIAMDYTRDPEICRAATINLTSREHIGAHRTRQDCARFAAELRDAYGSTTIVTCGAEGCMVAPRAETGTAIHVPAYAVPVMIDATGCGDVFRAGLLFGLLQHWELLKMLRFASAAAALNCGAMGGWGGVQGVGAIEAFLQTAPTL